MSQTFPRPADRRLIPMEFDESLAHARFELGEGQTRFDGALYGGTGIAASVMAMETATQRPAIWTTTQFVSSPMSGSVVELDIDVLAKGKRVSQVQVTARVNDNIAFVALGSTGVPRDGGLTGQFFPMPDVPGPEDSNGRHPMSRHVAHLEPHEHSYITRVEMRAVDTAANDGMLIWARLVDEPAMTPAGMAFVADLVPAAVTRAAGKFGGGPSLDNAMRFGPEVDTEWVLLELVPDFAAGGYGHGSVRVWSEDGTLAGTGGQTANIRFVVDNEADFAAHLREQA